VISLGIALYHGEFAAVSALMEHHGVPIDMEIFQQLADKDVWRAVRDEMVPVVDAQYGVYVRRKNSSDWTFSHELWIAYLKREGIYDAWPRLASGALDMRRKTFEDMTKVVWRASVRAINLPFIASSAANNVIVPCRV
jgi:hypothetical protein